MKIKSSVKKDRKKIITISAIAVFALALIGTVALAYINMNTDDSKTPANTNTVDYNEASDDQVTTGQDIKKNSVSSDKGTGSGSDQPVSSGETQNGKTVIGVVTSAQNVNDGVLQLRFRIDSKVSNGICTLTLSKGSATVTRTVSTFPSGGQYSTCQGFDIDISDLATGTWSLKLTVESPTIIGTASGEVTI